VISTNPALHQEAESLTTPLTVFCYGEFDFRWLDEKDDTPDDLRADIKAVEPSLVPDRLTALGSGDYPRSPLLGREIRLPCSDSALFQQYARKISSYAVALI
jgi:hypothetical protein